MNQKQFAVFKQDFAMLDTVAFLSVSQSTVTRLVSAEPERLTQ